MDVQSEKTVINNLKSLDPGLTLIVVTHRPSILELVDRVVVLDGGKVATDGPRQQVIKPVVTEAGSQQFRAHGDV